MLDAPDFGFEYIHNDLVGPLPRSFERTHAVTITDRFNRWPIFVHVLETDREHHEGLAEAVGYGFWRTDYNRQTAEINFNPMVRKFAKLLECSQNMTTTCYPSSHSMMERFHRQLKASLMSKEDSNFRNENLILVPLGILSSSASNAPPLKLF